ncbi:hypothetical protein A2U01_0027023, partial [Trifolium medium]|nr:hypothetical protein [Trifolium medium]
MFQTEPKSNTSGPNTLSQAQFPFVPVASHVSYWCRTPLFPHSSCSEYPPRDAIRTVKFILTAPLTLRQLSRTVITVFLYIRTRLWRQSTFPTGNHHSK